MANKSVVPEAKEALNRFKMEAANELGVPAALKTVLIYRSYRISLISPTNL